MADEAVADTRLQALASSLAVNWAFGLSSGKAALTTALEALHKLGGRRRQVIMPAYTCFSVPSAVLKAGLEPVPCDIGRGTFDYDYDQLARMLGPDVLCVLSVHLFGIPADTPRLVDLCHPAGIYVIEDAAQGLGGTQSGKPLGTRADVGIFSLGRGKNITCGAGGIIVTDVTEIAAEVRRLVDGLPASRVRDEIATLGGLALLCTFVSPRLYWFPSGLPFLRLGETIFHRDFPVGRISNVSASLLRNWAGRVQSANMARRATAARYCQEIAGAQHLGHGIPYLRFPMLVPAAARRRLLEDRDSRALGISPMYPATVAGISELSARFLGRSFPEAEYVASSLVTLPTHPLLSADDIAAVCRVVNAATESEITRRVDGDVGPPAVVGLRRTVGEQADTGRAAWVLHNRP